MCSWPHVVLVILLSLGKKNKIKIFAIKTVTYECIGSQAHLAKLSRQDTVTERERERERERRTQAEAEASQRCISLPPGHVFRISLNKH
jgi:hypothetical protein